MRVAGVTRSGARRRGGPAWAKLTDQELLELRFKDLDVTIEGTWLEVCLRDLVSELRTRGVVATPHAWISEEWFSPDNTPGISMPFYLTHPRLASLERKMVFHVEGGTKKECMQILRHETGHVVQHAYGLNRKRRWQQLFGKSSTAYPDFYRPNPDSKNFVQHLPRWYAQCHPDEDFAETFAVWLTSRSSWRRRYENWPALEKLEYVDELMSEIAGERPSLSSRVEVDPISRLSTTLGEHYRKKREHYAVDIPNILDRDLMRIFTDTPKRARMPSASAFLRRHRSEVRRIASERSGDPQLTLDVAFDEMIARSRELDLRVAGSEVRARSNLIALLTAKAVSSPNSTRRRWFAV
jgi:hypothetical protein